MCTLARACCWRKNSTSWESRGRILSMRARTRHLGSTMTWAVVSLVVLACVGGGLFWFGRDHSYFHVRAVRIYGAERVTQAELRQLTDVDGGTSVFRIDVDRVRT